MEKTTSTSYASFGSRTATLPTSSRAKIIKCRRKLATRPRNISKERKSMLAARNNSGKLEGEANVIKSRPFHGLYQTRCSWDFSNLCMWECSHCAGSRRLLHPASACRRRLQGSTPTNKTLGKHRMSARIAESSPQIWSLTIIAILLVSNYCSCCPSTRGVRSSAKHVKTLVAPSGFR